MQPERGPSRPRRLLHSAGIFALLAAVYFATYTGSPITTDELVLYDGVHSFVKYGHLQLQYTIDLRPYRTLPGLTPVLSLDTEPMQVYLTAPLVWIAAHVPGIGLMQAAWLMNVLTTALVAVMIYQIALLFGYRPRDSIITALMWGLASYAWVYSQMFFREPLFTLFALISAYGLEHWRRGMPSPLSPHPQNRGTTYLRAAWWLSVALVALTLALFTKEAGLFWLPVLTVIALPGALRRINLRVVLVFIALAAAVFGTILVYRAAFTNARFSGLLDRLLTLDTRYTLDALAGYLISPGVSVWSSSPVFLLGIGGAIMLWRTRRLRQLAIPIVALGSFVGGYALLRGDSWYSGLGWGARFLYPITPLLCLLVLPVVERFWSARWKPWLTAVVVGIVAQSVVSQVISVIMPIRAFSNYLGDEGKLIGRLINPWQDGTWNPLYLPHIVLAHQSGAPTEIAWWVNNSSGIVLPVCAAVAALAAFTLWRGQRTSRVVLLPALALGLLVMLYIGLRSFNQDVRYGGDNAALQQVMAHLEANVGPGDAIILDNPTYARFFMNEYRLNAPIYVLPIPIGEKPDENYQPEVTSPLPEEQVRPWVQILLSRVAAASSRWWYLTEYTPFRTDRFRSMELYLARHYFPARTEVDTPNARLLLVAPIAAPGDRIPPLPDIPSGLSFGATTLVGYDLPSGTTARPGQMFPISLLWRFNGFTGDVPPFNYSVNLSLVDAAGVVRAQRAEQPQGTFGQMTAWQVGGYYRDNHALALPADLLPGEYAVWVLWFDWSSGRKLPVTDSVGQRLGDYAILTKIRVEPNR